MTVNPVIQNSGTDRNIPFMFEITGQHAQDAFHVFPAHIPEGIGPWQDFHHILHLITAESRHGNQMLGQNVQTADRRSGIFHTAAPGKLCRHPAGYAFRRRPGEQIHHAHPPRIMACTAQSLHRARNRSGASHLKHLINFTHIDAKLHG